MDTLNTEELKIRLGPSDDYSNSIFELMSSCINKVKDKYNLDVPVPCVFRSWSDDLNVNSYLIIEWAGDGTEGEDWYAYLGWGSEGDIIDCSAWENIHDENSISIDYIDPSQDNVVELLVWVANHNKDKI